MAGSFSVAATRVDYGSHRLHPNTDPRVLSDLQDLLGSDLQLRPRNGRLRVAGSWVGFPLRPADLARRLPPTLVARIGAQSLTAPLRRSTPGSYAEALRGSLGPALYESLYEPFARKLWGLPGAALDVEQARRRVTADTAWKIAAKMLRRRRGNAQGQVFHYPVRGFGQIPEALADAAVGSGTDLRLHTNVAGVDVLDDRVRLTTDTGATFSAPQVFSTIPLPVLARITEPAPPAGALLAAAGLTFRAMLLVYVVHAGRPWTTYDAHYVPAASTPVSRISEPANYRESRDDPADSTVLCFEIPCSVDDEVWAATDHELATLAADTVSRLGLPPLSVVGVETRRLRRVYPIYATGYQRHLEGIDSWADGLARVTTFGRLGMFVHDNSHHAMAMAYDAVDALGDGGFDAAAWASARRRFAGHVVED